MYNLYIVTGAANGIGRSLVNLLSKAEFAFIICLDNDEKALNEIGQFLASQNKYSYVHLCDLTDTKSVDDAKIEVLKVIKKSGLEIERVVLFSVAGRALPNEFTSSDFPEPEVFNDSILLNLTSQYYFVRAFASMLLLGKQVGSVLLTSSINSIVDADMPAYSAAKSGLRGLAISLARVLISKYNSTINVALLGTVQPSDLLRSEPKDMRLLDNSTVRGFVMSEVEAAQSLKWIADAPASVIGREIVVDAGQSINFVRYIED